MKNLKIQLFVERFLQGTLIAYALLAVAEIVLFVAFGNWLFVYPAIAFVACAVIFANAEQRCKEYRRQLRLLQELEVCKNIPLRMPCPPRHRNITHVQKYEQKGKYQY